jgi:UDP-N-acetylmuramoylalanine--D-glutamate ligase
VSVLEVLEGVIKTETIGRVLVLGAGVSGVAAARLIQSHGGEALVCDESSAGIKADRAAVLKDCGAVYRGGGGDLPEGDFEFCVVSPSFAPEHRWLAECRRRRIPLISELEFGIRYWRGRILAVTGSKGKSTLVKLCSDTLNLAGQKAVAGGNYGIPLCELVLDASDAVWAVVEVSSFQMELSGNLAPDVAVLLNLQADHLDRHGTMEVYRSLKERLFAGQGLGQMAILPQGYREKYGWGATSAQAVSFGTAGEWCYKKGFVVAPDGSEMRLAGTWFDNDILGLAAAAGAAALRACGVTVADIERGWREFEPLRHRMELVGECGGVVYIHDSKATSLTALGAALVMAGRPVRLVAGGRLKESNLTIVKELLTKHVKKVYLIGECADQMYDAWNSVVSCELCGTIDLAVTRAHAEAKAGEAVVLTPGTASFDQFKSYCERGERFAAEVRRVANLTR